MSSYILGVDPGALGGMALLRGKKVVGVYKNPPDCYATLQLLARLSEVAEGELPCVMEKVGGFIKGNPAPGSAMFNFGRGVGILECAIAANHLTLLELVAPAKWQRLFISPRKKGEKDTAFKNRLKVKAMQLFPQVTVTLWNCDALLMAEYARRTYA